TTDGIERVEFADDPPKTIKGSVGPLKAKDVIPELAAEMVDVYRAPPPAAQAKKWHPVAAMELAIAPSDYGTASKYTFKDGFYSYVASTGDASLSVLSGELGGETTLRVDFKGSDPDTLDISGWTATNSYYGWYEPLLDGRRDYLTPHAAGVFWC